MKKLLLALVCLVALSTVSGCKRLSCDKSETAATK